MDNNDQGNPLQPPYQPPAMQNFLPNQPPQTGNQQQQPPQFQSYDQSNNQPKVFEAPKTFDMPKQTYEQYPPQNQQPMGQPPAQNFNQGQNNPPPMYPPSYPAQDPIIYPPQDTNQYPPIESNNTYPPQEQGGNQGLRQGGGPSDYSSYEKNNYRDNKGSYDPNFDDRVSYPRLYVGKFPRGTTKRELENLFSRYGEIVDSMVKEDYAFIEFSTLRQAGEALENLHKFNYKGNKLIVEESKPRNNEKSRKTKEQSGVGVSYPRLYVGKIGGSKKQDIERLFERYGNLVDCMVSRDADYGFVEFENCEQAQRALEAMHQFKYRGNRLIVEESKPRNDGGSRGAPSRGGDRGGGRDSRGGDRGGRDSRGGDRGGRDNRSGPSSNAPPKNSEYGKVRGLPFNQFHDDLIKLCGEVIQGIESHNVVLEFDTCGKFSGSAYVKLRNPADFPQLKQLEQKKLGKRYIEVIPVDSEDFQYGIDNNIPTDPRNYRVSETPQTQGMIRLRGIPYKCTDEQLRELFKGFQITDTRILQQGDRAAGEALVMFSSKEAAIHSLNWEGQQIDGRYIEITLSNTKEYEVFRRENWDVDNIKSINEREERRLKDARAQRSGRGRKQSEDFRGGDRGRNDRSRSTRPGGGDRGGDRGRNNSEACYSCGDYNHISKDCPDRKGGDGDCFKCGQPGHKSRDCRGGGRQNGGRDNNRGGDRRDNNRGGDRRDNNRGGGDRFRDSRGGGRDSGYNSGYRREDFQKEKPLADLSWNQQQQQQQQQGLQGGFQQPQQYSSYPQQNNSMQQQPFIQQQQQPYIPPNNQYQHPLGGLAQPQGFIPPSAVGMPPQLGHNSQPYQNF